jgi:putative transposase
MSEENCINFVLTLTLPSMKIEYKNLYIHYILTTLHRLPVISENSRERIEKYITGIVNKYNSQLYSIYCNPEHIHFLVSRSPEISDEKLVDIVGTSSAKFINENKLCHGKFDWQVTASAFSVSKKDVDRVCKYILNQAEHHKRITFEEEYQDFVRYYQKTLIRKF